MKNALLTAALAIGFSFAAGSAEEAFNTVAIKINTQGISIREVETTFADSLILIQDKLRRGEIKQPELPDAIRKGWSEALETTIEDKIIDQRANELHKDIIKQILARAGQSAYGEQAVAMFNREVAYISRRLRQEMITAAGGEQELRAALKRRGQTMHDWESTVQLELFRREVIGMELGRVVVRPTEVRTFFDKHPDIFRQPDAWRLRRIRIAKNAFASAETALKATKLARDNIVNGGDFEKVARKVSDDAEFAPSGGLMNRDEKSDQPTGTFPDEEHIADHLKDGEISDPVEINDWYELVQRVSYKPTTVQTFEQASERAEAMAFSEKLKQKKKEMYEKLKDQSFIEILVKEPPKHYFEAIQADPNQFVTPNDGKTNDK